MVDGKGKGFASPLVFLSRFCRSSRLAAFLPLFLSLLLEYVIFSFSLPMLLSFVLAFVGPPLYASSFLLRLAVVLLLYFLL